MSRYINKGEFLKSEIERCGCGQSERECGKSARELKPAVFIAGPITGVEDYWVPFKQAEEMLSLRQCIPLDPAKLPEGMQPWQYERICMAMIDSADAVLFLPGWEMSRGAALEHAYCVYTEKQIVYNVDDLRLMYDFEKSPTINQEDLYGGRRVLLLDDVYRVIAGHSDYHGDNILSALTCIAEGKEVKPVKPLEDLRPKGKWIGLEYDGYADGNPVYDLWECSNCGNEEKGEDVPEQNPFCRCCGMQAEEDKHEDD